MSGVCDAVLGLLCIFGAQGETIERGGGLHRFVTVQGNNYSAELIVSDVRVELDYNMMDAVCAQECAYIWSKCSETFCEYYVDGGPSTEPVRMRVTGSVEGRKRFSSLVAILPRGGFFPLRELSFRSTPDLPVRHRVRP